MAKKPKEIDKTSAASTYKNNQVANLLSLASAAPALSFKANKSTARLFEIVVLADILSTYAAAPTYGQVVLKNAVNGEMNFAGSPCSADKVKYSWFELTDAPGAPVNEAWVSVQFTTLSWERDGSKSPPEGADKHEIDIGIFSSLAAASHYPSFRQLRLGVSCKHFPPSGVHARGTWPATRVGNSLRSRQFPGTMARGFRSSIPRVTPLPCIVQPLCAQVLNSD